MFPGAFVFVSALGHYLYIETSGLYSKDLRTTIARLYSPLFPPVENNETCFTFWYHMFGSTIGELAVYIDGHKVFQKSGNQGNRWIRGIIKNLPTDTHFQISIEGVPGSGWTGDIAIDDLNITNSIECTRPEIEDTSCDGRCYEEELKNSTLCQCHQKCVATLSCCSDFFDVCNAEKTSTDLPYISLQNEDETSLITTEESFESSTIENLSSGITSSNNNYKTSEIISSDDTVTDYGALETTNFETTHSFTETETTETNNSWRTENSNIYMHNNYSLNESNNYIQSTTDTKLNKDTIIHSPSISMVTAVTKPSMSSTQSTSIKMKTFSANPSIISTNDRPSLIVENTNFSTSTKKDPTNHTPTLKIETTTSNHTRIFTNLGKDVSTGTSSSNHFFVSKKLSSGVIMESASTNPTVISTSYNKSVIMETTSSIPAVTNRNPSSSVIMKTTTNPTGISTDHNKSVIVETTTSNLFVVSKNPSSSVILKTTTTNPTLISTDHYKSVIIETTGSNHFVVSKIPTSSVILKSTTTNPTVISTDHNDSVIVESTSSNPFVVSKNLSSSVMETTTKNPPVISTKHYTNVILETTTSIPAIFSANPNTKNIKSETTTSNSFDISTKHSTNVIMKSTTLIPYFISSHINIGTDTTLNPIQFNSTKYDIPNTSEEVSTNKSNLTLSSGLRVTIPNNTFKTVVSHTHLHKNINLSQTTEHMLQFINDSFEEIYLTTENTETEFNYSLQTTKQYSPFNENITETIPIEIIFTRTEKSKWKTKYKPKGYFTYSAIKQEQTNNGLRNVGIILGIAVIFIIAASVGLYIYRRRSFLSSSNDIEEADVLFIPTDEMLDFSLSRQNSNFHRKQDINKV